MILQEVIEMFDFLTKYNTDYPTEILYYMVDMYICLKWERL